MRKFLCFAVVVCLMSACGTPTEREVNVTDIPITGFLKDYVKVVDGPYKFTNDGDDAFISVKSDLVKRPDISYRKSKYSDIRLNPTGENGEVFDSGMYGFSAKYNEFAKIEDLLTGSIGDTKTISFKWDYFNQDKELGKRMFTEAISVEIIYKGFEIGESDATPSLSSTGANKSSGSSKWDKVLDEYEKYIDKYIALYRKAKNGDISAMSAYAEMLEKAESYSEELSNAEGSMSASQMSRYLKLTEKMTNTLME